MSEQDPTTVAAQMDHLRRVAKHLEASCRRLARERDHALLMWGEAEAAAEAFRGLLERLGPDLRRLGMKNAWDVVRHVEREIKALFENEAKRARDRLIAQAEAALLEEG